MTLSTLLSGSNRRGEAQPMYESKPGLDDEEMVFFVKKKTVVGLGSADGFQC